MILKDDEADERLNSPKNLLNQLKSRMEVVPLAQGGRKDGQTEIPPKVRELIKTFTNKDENQSEIASAFEISQATVSGLSRGLVGDRFEPSLAQEEPTKEDNAHELALDLLMSSMEALKPKLIDPSLKAKDLSRIASDMSKIVGGVRGSGDDKGSANKTQIIIFAPEQKKLSDFSFIEG